MPLLNLKKIIPFHSGGGGGAASCFPLVFLVILVIISVRHLNLTVFNHVYKGCPPSSPKHIVDSRGNVGQYHVQTLRAQRQAFFNGITCVLPPLNVTFCHYFDFQNTYNNFFRFNRICGFFHLLWRGCVYNGDFGLVSSLLRHDLWRPCTMVILAQIFLAPAAHLPVVL